MQCINLPRCGLVKDIQRIYSFLLNMAYISSREVEHILIFSYTRRLGSFFGLKILNFNIFGGFQKK